MTASFSSSRVSNRPPFASKQEEYRIVSSIDRYALKRSSKLAMHGLRAADEAHRGDAVAIAGEALVCRFDNGRMVGQSQVVVGAEIDHLASVGKRDHRALRRADDALALQQSCGVERLGISRAAAREIHCHAWRYYSDFARRLFWV